MSKVYIDATALLGPRTSGSASTRILLEAARACRHLRELGHEVRLLGSGGAARTASRSRHPGEHNADPDPADGGGGWLVSGDPAVCDRVRRQRRLRTVLVGPATPGRGGVERPADVLARSLGAAVMTILAAEAMPSTGAVA